MFLVKFWKKSFLDVPINANMFSVLEFCCEDHVPLPTLYTKYSVYMLWQYHHSLRTEEDIKNIEINFQTRVFLPVRVKPFFASLDNLHLYMFHFGDYSHIFRYSSFQECWFITADQTVFKSDGKGTGPGGWWFLQLYSKLNLKSRSVSMDFFYILLIFLGCL